MPGASVTITDPATGFTKTSQSGATGLYDFNGLNPANYNLKVAAKGFQTYDENGIVVNVSMTFRHDVKLTVGAESQTVTVSADALTVQTDSNVVSTLINSEQISEIATENRNFAALAALGLGVSSALPDSNTPTSVAASFTLSINGLRQSHNIWLIDGGEADDRGGAGGMDIMPSQDAIAEFNVLASNYPPDYGISSGATMSLSLKSGTQKFHGEAWEFNRTTDYNANTFFDKAGSGTPTARPATHYNIFGYNVGGPLYIPHVYNTNKQKTFFFYNEEWRKVLSSAGTNVEHTIDPADIPKAGSDLNYKAPAFATGTNLVVPNISTSSYYYKNKLQPLGLVRPIRRSQATPFRRRCLTTTACSTSTRASSRRSPTRPRTRTRRRLRTRSTVLDTVLRIDHKFSDKWAILGHYMDDQVTQGYAAAGTGMAVGQLQHPHQHPVQPVAVCGHQDERYDQSEPAARGQHQLRRQRAEHHSQLQYVPAFGLDADSYCGPIHDHPQGVARHGLLWPLRNGRRHRLGAVAQRGPRLRAQGGHLVHHGQACHEVRVQL